ncbi:MAG: 2-oxo acid dehydrogenase subunit E2 [Phycisphaeraceae bacterium]|nr:2-oxo acid dehydrogenase subunit E2 [Phycisphaeraceae bacterium]MCW5753387.1 2-oxo acid dehydrogenase subunit E2 [Phycisphaeraceae bacterium]
MPIKVTMPRLSDTMERGTVVKWNVKPGDKVSQGEVLADIETDKATMELQSFDNGTVAQLAVKEGESVGVGAVILVLAGEGEDPAAAGNDTETSAPEQAPASAMSEGAAASHRAGSPAPTAVRERPAEAASGHAENGHRVFASPLAKKIAADEGVDLAGIRGSGPGGRIVRKDVEAAIASGGAAAPAEKAASALPAVGAALAGRTVALSSMRGVIAKRLVESKTTIPHYQVTVEVDMDALVLLRGQLNEQLAPQGVKLSINDFLVRACALAMHQHPYVNSRWISKGSEAAIELLDRVNIGIAVALPMEKGGGLVVGTVRDADRIGLRAISTESKRLSDKARGKGLSIEEMSDSTFTISNLGMFGVSHFTAIINPPNTAILAVGAALERPVSRKGQITSGHVMSMTMSSDHRVIDGAMAAQYLATVKDYLEKPATLLV